MCLSSSHIELPWARADGDDEPEDAQPKTKKETRWGWELLNDNKAIWLRSAGDVEEEEYVKFYQALSKVCLCAFCLSICLTVCVFVPVCICLSLCLSVCLYACFSRQQCSKCWLDHNSFSILLALIALGSAFLSAMGKM